MSETDTGFHTHEAAGKLTFSAYPMSAHVYSVPLPPLKGSAGKSGRAGRTPSASGQYGFHPPGPG